MNEKSSTSTSLPTFGTVSILILVIPSKYEVLSHYGFSLHSLMSNHVEHLFMCLLVIGLSFVLCQQIFCSALIGLFVVN